jgi:hypothetical protein
MMKEPVMRTWLIIGTFAAPGLANCREDDHERILRAFDARVGQGGSRSRGPAFARDREGPSAWQHDRRRG